jgi:hypothetical protein
MSAKDDQMVQSGDLVLIGEYLRAPNRPPKGKLEADSGPERWRHRKAQPGDGSLFLLQAVLRYCTYPQIAELKECVDGLDRLRQDWEKSSKPPAPDQLDQADELLRQQRELKDSHDSKQFEEIQDIVVMFHRAVAALSQGSRRNLGRLGTLERDVDQASRLGDLSALRGRLGTMLEFIRTEKEEEKAQSQNIVEKLQKDFQTIEVTSPDSGSGLAGRDLALATLRRGWGPSVMVAVVYLDQVRSVSERHGPETAQRLVGEILGQVANRVDVPYTAYTWDMNSVLLIFDGVSDDAQVRRLVRQQLVTIPGTFILDVASRKTLFRFPHRWMVLSHADEPNTEKAVAMLEGFLESQQG